MRRKEPVAVCGRTDEERQRAGIPSCDPCCDESPGCVRQLCACPYVGLPPERNARCLNNSVVAANVPGGPSPERFAEFMKAERAKYATLVKDAGIKIDS